MSEQLTTAALRKLAEEARRQARFDEAAQLYREAVRLYPEDPARSQRARRDVDALNASADTCAYMASISDRN